MAMSKEEKALRDALAKVKRDSAASDAAVKAINSGAATASTTTTTPRVPSGSNYGAFVEGPGFRPPAPASSQQGTTDTKALTPEQIEANRLALEKQQEAAAEAEKKRRAGQSAYDLLLGEFNQYGLGTLVESVKNLITSGASEAELTLALRQTEPYKKRFAANASRLANGLRALSEAEYIGLEDQYQNVMRNYGLPPSYYTKDATGKQEGFEKFIAGDVSPAELEDRVMIAQNRVVNAPPQVKEALRQFYPGIKDADILAYTLDPSKGLEEIKRKVTAAEIGGAAMGQGLGTSASRAEELARFGVTAESARAGFGAIGGGLERGSQLASIYQQPDYTQTVAEEEVFNLPGQTGAQRKRKKLIGLEQAEFGGQSGITSGALGRERAGSF